MAECDVAGFERGAYLLVAFGGEPGTEQSLSVAAGQAMVQRDPVGDGGDPVAMMDLLGCGDPDRGDVEPLGGVGEPGSGDGKFGSDRLPTSRRQGAVHGLHHPQGGKHVGGKVGSLRGECIAGADGVGERTPTARRVADLVGADRIWVHRIWVVLGGPVALEHGTRISNNSTISKRKRGKTKQMFDLKVGPVPGQPTLRTEPAAALT